jgi:hypothetical protein
MLFNISRAIGATFAPLKIQQNNLHGENAVAFLPAI